VSPLTSAVTRRAAAAGGSLAVAGAASTILLSGGAPATGRTMHASPRPAAAASASTTISARSTRLGRILVNSRGDVLYAFTRDSRNKDACASVRGCRSVWPPETVNGSLKAGRGVQQRLLGTIRVDGRKQATYAGHPLYGYVGNTGPGNTGYVGISSFGGTWLAVKTTGRLVR
jgi:predicted lipoprotein with Yx(FWY)xxD motif